MSTPDAIQAIGLPPSMAKLLRYLALRPSGRPSLRELQRELGIGSRSSQRDLSRLVSLGVLRRNAEGRSVRYELNQASPLWWALLQLVGQGTPPEALLGVALRGVKGIEAAFLFGSTAAGNDRADSDVDLFVIADDLDARMFHRVVAEAGLVLAREVNPVKYTKAELARRLAGRTTFVREALAGPKRWVAGNPSAIEPIAIAAGVPFVVENQA